MIRFVFTSLILVLVGCGQTLPPGNWPDTKYSRTVLERAALDGRIVVIEQMPRFLVAGGGSATNFDASFDHYVFWDFCRGPDAIWQMVTLRPDGRARSGWSYTQTLVSPAQNGRDGHTQVTEGFLRQPVNGFPALKAAGLSFFQPGLIRCDAQYGDIIVGA